jgi:16S rRNA (guanine1207-N2)-methyltransferase
MSRAADPRFYTNELLQKAIAPAGQRILALGIAAPLIVAWARAAGDAGTVVAVEHWLSEWRELEHAAQHEPAPSLQRHFTSQLDKLGDQVFDICALDCSSYQSNRALALLAHAAAQRLVPNGTLYAAGPKEAGIMALSTRLEELFGNVEALAYRKGQRVVAAQKLGSIAAPRPDDLPKPLTLTIRGHTWELEEMPGVFARGALDDATAMLINALEIMPQDTVLDLGCGSGIIGMVAARLAPEHDAVLTDADAYALDLAASNCRRNGVANARIVAADVVDAVAEERFTVVACNPPFHRRNEQSSHLADRFMRGAESVLAQGGRLYFVANRFLPYEARLERLFGNVTEVAGDARYKVLLAKKG